MKVVQTMSKYDRVVEQLCYRMGERDERERPIDRVLQIAEETGDWGPAREEIQIRLRQERELLTAIILAQMDEEGGIVGDR